MCGICGFFSKSKINKNIIREMNEEIFHRGPDEDGFYDSDKVNMAMRRLSIIDLKGGTQPIFSNDKSKAIVFNGEIYNFLELREDLVKQGIEFQTRCDTEVILRGYEVEGKDFISKLNGMFAFSIYDKEKDSLLIARDRVGIKPLHYYSSNEVFVWGSEIKSILKFPSFTKEINYNAVNNFFKLKYIPEEDTIFQNVKKLKPGHLIEVCTKTGQILNYEQYWNIPSKVEVTYDYEEHKYNIREILTDAVKKRLISDVPFGAFLSGGVDSTVIVGIMSQLSNTKTKTFSIGFKEKSFNESDYAKLTADLHQTEHHESIIEPENIFDLLENLIDFIDEPSGDTSIIPTYWVSRETRKHVTVALSGSGADEIFAGYERYWVDKLSNMYNNIPLPLRKISNYIIENANVNDNKKSIVFRAKKLLSSAKFSAPSRRLQDLLTVLDNEERTNLFTQDTKDKIQLFDEDLFEKYFNYVEGDFLAKGAYNDIKTLMVDDYLIKEDRMSMANSLEVRVPFLDHRLIEYSFKIPTEWKLKGLTTKYILKDTFKDLIPEAIIKRSKHGFEAPLSVWFKNQLKDEVYERLLSGNAVDKIYRKDYVKKILDDHFNSVYNYGKAIFCLLTFEIWYTQHFSSK